MTGFQVTQGKYEKSLFSKEVLIRYKCVPSSKCYMLCNDFDHLELSKKENKRFFHSLLVLFIIRAITTFRVVKSDLRQT